MIGRESIREVAKVVKKLQLFVEAELEQIKRDEPELKFAYKLSKEVSSNLEDFLRRTE